MTRTCMGCQKDGKCPEDKVYDDCYRSIYNNANREANDLIIKAKEKNNGNK